jgi:hypothetical protein
MAEINQKINPLNPEVEPPQPSELRTTTLSSDLLTDFLKKAKNDQLPEPTKKETLPPQFTIIDPVLKKAQSLEAYGVNCEIPVYKALLSELVNHDPVSAVIASKTFGHLICNLEKILNNQLFRLTEDDQLATNDSTLKKIPGGQQEILTPLPENFFEVLKIFWGPLIDQATIICLERITHQTDSITLENWSIFPEHGKEVSVSRVSANINSNQEQQATSPSPDQINTTASQAYTDLKQFFAELGLPVNVNYLDLNLWDPYFDFARNFNGIAFSDSGNKFSAASITTLGKLPEEEFVNDTAQTHWSHTFTTPQESVLQEHLLLHEGVHALTPFYLPTLFNEGLAVLAQTKSESIHQNAVFSQINLTQEYTLLEKLKALTEMPAEKIAKLTWNDKYCLSTLFLFCLSEKNPELCGRFLENISAAAQQEEALSLTQILEKSAQELGINITTEELEESMQKTVKQAKEDKTVRQNFSRSV